jgi:flagellar transcriptional activator FlhC
MAMAGKSIINEAHQIELGIELIELGARLQVLEVETSLSRERLRRLYKEVKGVSPPKGMLPFSTDWFVTWQPNIHASLFMEIQRFLIANTRTRGIAVTIKAFRLYLEHALIDGMEPILTFTRAWTLVRYSESRLLALKSCEKCAGRFVVNSMDLHNHYICGLCAPPSRAGKTRKVAVSAEVAGS